MAALLLVSSPAASAADVIIRDVFGLAFEERFGYSAAGTGDLDDDGKPDIIVGAYHNSEFVYRAGRAYVISSATGLPIHTFTGEAEDDQFGTSVASAGDVNMDGTEDLIVGAAQQDAAGESSGRAYVYSGTNGDLLWTFDGDAAWSRLGISVSGAGDFNADGHDDLIVGAEGDNGFIGKAVIFSGLDGTELWSVTGQASGDSLGRSVAGLGDLDGDDFGDVIIGSAGASLATIYSGQSREIIHELNGEAAGDLFGWSAACAGDVDADGVNDVIVGARYNGAAGQFAGRAYVYSGASGFLLHRFTGETAGDQFGYAVGGGIDVNGDGYDDLMVGAPNNGTVDAGAGRAYLFSGRTGALVQVLDGLAWTDSFGFSVAGVGAVDADAHGDFIVGAYRHDSAGHNTGMVTLFSGAPTEDRDGDAVTDGFDNCPDLPNAVQQDTDQDGWGDACDAPGDINHNGSVNLNDFLTFAACFQASSSGQTPGCGQSGFSGSDLDGNQVVDLVDLLTFAANFMR